jgi:hypothetical protein
VRVCDGSNSNNRARMESPNGERSAARWSAAGVPGVPTTSSDVDVDGLRARCLFINQAQKKNKGNDLVKETSGPAFRK